MLQWLIGSNRKKSGVGDNDGDGATSGLRDRYRGISLLPAFRQAERLAKLGFWRLDISTGEVFWSPEVFAIHGLPDTREVPVERALEFYPGEHGARIRQAVSDATASGAPYDLELDFICEKGVKKRVRTIGEPEHVNGEVVAVFGVIQDISERYRLEQELREAAITDPLTGLPNRRHLEMFYTDSRLDCTKTPYGAFALAIIDMDHFKSINDVHGHSAGDHALKVVARRLRTSWLESCFAARLGGDEFVLIILDNELLGDLQSLCEHLLADLRQPMKWQGEDLKLSATIGVAAAGAGGIAISDVIECADAALYVAKAQGRGTAAISSREDLFLADGCSNKTSIVSADAA